MMARSILVWFFAALSLISHGLAQPIADIGVEISKPEGVSGYPQHFARIARLVPDGPAERSGLLRVNDLIVSIAEGEKEFESVAGKELGRVSAMLRGNRGSTVRLYIARKAPSYYDRELVTITRDKNPQLEGDRAKKKAEGLKLEYVLRQQGRLVGFFSEFRESDCLYVFTLDVASGKLIDDVRATYTNGLFLESNRTKEQQIHEAIQNNNGLYLFCDETFLRQFNAALPKYHEWASKAYELKPAPFKKLLPNSEVKRGNKAYSAYFVWAPESDGGSPTAQIIFNETVFGRTSQTLALKEGEVKLAEAAIGARSRAEQELVQVMKEAKENAQTQRQKVDDNFN